MHFRFNENHMRYLFLNLAFHFIHKLRNYFLLYVQKHGDAIYLQGKKINEKRKKNKQNRVN